MLEPCESKVSRTVLRGLGAGNRAWLLGRGVIRPRSSRRVPDFWSWSLVGGMVSRAVAAAVGFSRHQRMSAPGYAFCKNHSSRIAWFLVLLAMAVRQPPPAISSGTGPGAAAHIAEWPAPIAGGQPSKNRT